MVQVACGSTRLQAYGERGVLSRGVWQLIMNKRLNDWVLITDQSPTRASALSWHQNLTDRYHTRQHSSGSQSKQHRSDKRNINLNKTWSYWRSDQADYWNCNQHGGVFHEMNRACTRSSPYNMALGPGDVNTAKAEGLTEKKGWMYGASDNLCFFYPLGKIPFLPEDVYIILKLIRLCTNSRYPKASPEGGF